MQQERPEEPASPTSGYFDGETLLGVRVVEADTPALTGRELASQMGAELTSDPNTTAEALTRRVEAGLTPPLVLAHDEYEALRDQAAGARRTLDRANVDDTTRAELVNLGDELARADRIRMRTESALTESLSRRLSASTGLSVHPDSLRSAAAAVAEARARVTLATRELDELGPPPDPATVEDVVADPPSPEPTLGWTTGPLSVPGGPAGFDPTLGPMAGAELGGWMGDGDDNGPILLSHEAPERKKPPLWVAIAAGGLVPVTLVLVLVSVISFLFFLMFLVVLGGILGGWYYLYRIWVEEQEHEAAIAAAGAPPTAPLAPEPVVQPVAPSAGPRPVEQPWWPAGEADPRATGWPDPTPTQPPAPAEADPVPPAAEPEAYDPVLGAWHERLEVLSVAVDHAEDILRGALARWEALAGPGAHPDDVETVIQSKDPQFQYASLAAQESATMRTVNAFHRKAMAKWRVAWAMLGYDEPPTPDQVDDELAPTSPDQLKDAHAILERAEAAERWAAAGALIDQPLVVADIQGWFPTDEVSDLIHSLPAGVHVVVVRPTTNGD
jgi:hypothetical protein